MAENRTEIEIINQFFSYTPTREVIKFINHLGDCKDQIREILLEEVSPENKYYNFIAPMGSGKTYTILQIALENGIKLIFLTPLLIIALQKFEEFEKNEIFKNLLTLVHGNYATEGHIGVKSADIRDRLHDDKKVFICVYDSLRKFYDEILDDSFNASEYILVIDEAHCLATEYSYRKGIIDFINDVKKDFKKVIYLTGTPEFTLDRNNINIIFVKDSIDSEEEIRKTIKIIEYEKKGLLHLCRHALSNNEGQNVILVNNKKVLPAIKEVMETFSKESIKVGILSGALKESYEYIFLVKREMIPPDLNYLITTQVISDGSNITNDIDTVYIFDDNLSYWTKRQFLMRFRNDVKNIIEFRKKEREETSDFEKISSYFEDQKSTLQHNISIILERYENGRSINSNIDKKKFLIKSIQNDVFLYYSEFTNNLAHSEDAIRNQQIQVINDALRKNIEYTRSFFDEFANTDIEVSQIDSGLFPELTEEKFEEIINKSRFLPIKENPAILDDSFPEIAFAYVNKYPDKLPKEIIYSDFKRVAHSKIKQPYSYNADDYAKCVKDKKSRKYMYEAIDLYLNGFPMGLISRLIKFMAQRGGKYSSFRKRIDILSCKEAASGFSKKLYLFEHPKLTIDYIIPLALFDELKDKEKIVVALKKELKSRYIDDNPFRREKSYDIMDYLNALFEGKNNDEKGIYKIFKPHTIESLLGQNILFGLDYEELNQLRIMPLIKLRGDIIKIMPEASTDQSKTLNSLLKEIDKKIEISQYVLKQLEFMTTPDPSKDDESVIPTLE